MTALDVFNGLLTERLIVDFCSDPSRRMSPSGFDAGTNRVSENDAADFLRAWCAGLPVHEGRGQYIVGTGRVREQFFWSGRKSLEQRTFRLWLEPIIAVGAIARLHFDYGWPLAHVAAQSTDWAFDIVAMSDPSQMAIAGEVKKSRREIDDLYQWMVSFGSDPDALAPAGGKARNAFKKVASLRRDWAPILWLVGPDRYERLFNVVYKSGSVIEFEPTSSLTLSFIAA